MKNKQEQVIEVLEPYIKDPFKLAVLSAKIDQLYQPTNNINAEQFYNQKSIDLNYKDFEHYIDCREYDVLQKEIIEWTEQFAKLKNKQ